MVMEVAEATEVSWGRAEVAKATQVDLGLAAEGAPLYKPMHQFPLDSKGQLSYEIVARGMDRLCIKT